MKIIKQKIYPDILIDNLESDVVMIHQDECIGEDNDLNVINVERKRLQSFINHLQTLVR